MYVWLLTTHSWLRYLVLLLGAALFLASLRGRMAKRAWQPSDTRLQQAFIAALNLQVVLGLGLYFGLSPYASAALADLGSAMSDPQLRFWGVEHSITMLIATALAHVGKARSRRAAGEGGSRHRTLLVFQGLWLALTLAAIPWPGLDIGRPLFRL